MLVYLLSLSTVYAFLSPMASPGVRQLASTFPMVYHGGPVLNTNASIHLKLHFLLYGNWQSPTGLIFDFVKAVGASSYLNILTSYAKIKNVKFEIGTVQKVPNPSSSLLKDSDIPSLLRSLFIPQEGQVYVVLTSSEISISNGQALFCRDFCGYHNFDSQFLYMVVGDSSRCPQSCQIESKGPNYLAGASPGIDGIINILIHEIAEVITDPKFNGWSDKLGQELGDKCNWNFGTYRLAQNGAKCNLSLVIGNATACFMVQQLWLNTRLGKCAMSY
jgi:Phosphate-induced protein 1 conserved region